MSTKRSAIHHSALLTLALQQRFWRAAESALEPTWRQLPAVLREAQPDAAAAPLDVVR